MDLLWVFGVVRRHWIAALLWIVVGCVAAFAVSFHVVTEDGKIRLESTSHTIYSSKMQLLVTEPGFGLGSAGLDVKRLDGFDKTVAMAPVYAELILSDPVMSEVASRTGTVTEQIVAEAVKDTPIVKITVTGDDPSRLGKVAVALGVSLEDYLKREQARNSLPATDSLSVSMMAQPERPVPQQSRAWELALIAFLAPVAFALGVALMLDRHADTTAAGGE